VQDAKKLTIVQNGKTVQWGAAVDNWEEAIDSVTHSFGADQVNSSYTQATMSDPAYRSALGLYNDLAWKLHVSPTLQDYANYGANVNRDALFADGKTAMIWAGLWDIPVDYQDKLSFGISEPPIGAAGNANMMGVGTALTVGAHSAYTQTDFNIVKCMTSPTAQRIMVNNREDIPSSLVDQPLWVKTLPPGVSYAALAQDGDMVFSPRSPAVFDTMQTVISQDLYPLFTGKETVAAATQSANSEVNSLLANLPQ
jgi:multiple sugar transport system substrate-binding protein